MSCVTLLLVLLAPAASGEVDAVLERVREVQANDLDSWRRLRFRRVVTREKLDGEGHVREREVLLFRVRPVGDGFDEELILADGREPRPLEVREHREAGRFEKHYRTLGRPGGDGTEDGAETFTLGHLMHLSSYRLAGAETVSGVPCLRIDFSPVDALREGSRADRLADSMQGSLWVSSDGLHLVRVRARAARPVKVAAGLAAVRGLEIEVENAPVGDAWLPRRIEVRTALRVMLGRSRKRNVYEYSDFGAP